jgi:hypothetical protein
MANAPDRYAQQSRTMSMVEAVVNVVVGFVLALMIQLMLFPPQVAFRENMFIAVVFTVVSIARSYLLRRLFESLRAKILEAS